MSKNGSALLEKPLAENAISTLRSMTRKGSSLSGKKKRAIRMLCRRINEYASGHSKIKGNVVYVEIPKPDLEAVKKLVLMQ